MEIYGFYKHFIPAYNENPYGPSNNIKVLSLDEGDPFPNDKYLKKEVGKPSLVEALSAGLAKE